MIYNWTDGSLRTAKIKDANGAVITNVIECDTETGTMSRHSVKPNGICEQNPNGSPVVINETRPAPLTVVFDA